MEKQTDELLLLSQASNEIKQCRVRMNTMGARLKMFDDMMLLFTSKPNNENGSCAPDLVWEIDRYIESKSKKTEIQS